jgi:hypothetical protein
MLATFPERRFADFPPRIFIATLAPACTAQLFSHPLDALALPQFPDVPALMAQLSQYATSLAQPGFNFRTLIPSLSGDAECVCASSKMCGGRVWAYSGNWPDRCYSNADGPVACRDDRYPLALYVHIGASRTSLIAILVSVIPAESNEPRLLAPAALLGDLVTNVDASLAKTFGVLLSAPWMRASRFRSLDGVLGAVRGL